MKKQKIMTCFSFCLFFITLITLCLHNKIPVFTTHKAKKIIVIDVGHGGTDPGKVSPMGIEEKAVNLQIASYLRDYLIAADYIVFMTRESDCNLYDASASNKKRSDLNNRITFFKEKQADYVVSIHQNSFPDTKQHGAQTFYYTQNEESKHFAESIQDALRSFDETNKRSAKANESYFLLKNSPIPTVIVECGFLSNPEETSKLTDPYYQKQLASAICLGICRTVK